MEAKLALESSLERRLGTVLQQILDSRNVFVIVNVQLVMETPSGSEDDLLPGVPEKNSPGSPAPLQLSSSLVRRLSATVYLDRAAAPADATKAKAKAEEMLGIDPRRGDAVTIERINFPKADAPAAPLPFAPAPTAPVVAAPAGGAGAGAVATPPKSVRIPQYIFSTLWLLVAAVGLLILARLEAPLGSLFRQLVESLRALASLPQRQREAQEKTAEAKEIEKEVAGKGVRAEPAGRKLPFAFVEPGDAPTLKLLLRSQKPARAAAVLHFLPPAVASEVLAGLPPQMREEVLGLMRRPTALNPASVARLEESIRSQLDYLMGGEERLLSMLDGAPANAKAALLGDLERADPALARRISGRIVIFDDLAKLDEAGFKTLARTVSIQSLAVAIRSSEPLRAAVMPRLHGGTAEWLAQEIELLGELPPAVLDAKVSQVVVALTKLVREGKIVLRKDADSPPPEEFETVVELPPEPEETPAPLRNLPGFEAGPPKEPAKEFPAPPAAAPPPAPASRWAPQSSAEPPSSQAPAPESPPALPSAAPVESVVEPPPELKTLEPLPVAGAPTEPPPFPAAPEIPAAPQPPAPAVSESDAGKATAPPLFPWRMPGERLKPPSPKPPPPVKGGGLFPWRQKDKPWAPKPKDDRVDK